VVGACEWNLPGYSVVQRGWYTAGVDCGEGESFNYLHGRNLSDQWRGATRVAGDLRIKGRWM
jgi:hypothetical protein